ncbi:nuclear transport factor 2 family protein [Sphingobium sp.]|uniref:nuclear transport factor 2 family protein n=1 Tax=Sphingobium sp. TaxID=1912891 RepID=UPI002638442B|nr:nuclear transport factor 2 family protein [Sphingobium sp.]
MTETLTLEALARDIAALRSDMAVLLAEAGARRVLGQYMRLCDVPRLLSGIAESERCRAIANLFTPDAIWEGVGGAHGAQFGQMIGRDAIAAHFERFYTQASPPQIFNTHYLCTESLTASADKAEGHWVQFQPWVDAEGQSLLRSSRLHVQFALTDGQWLIAHYRTENLFIAPLPQHWWQRLIEEPALTIEGLI